MFVVAFLECLRFYIFLFMPTDDGAMFFDEKIVDALEYQGPLSTTSSVVRGLVAFADVTSGKITVSTFIGEGLLHWSRA